MPWMIFFAVGCAPPAGKGGDSAVDNLAPVLTLDAPVEGAVLPGSVQVAGFVADDHDEPGAVMVTATDSASGSTTSLLVGVDGQFDQDLTLSAGAHVITFLATDTEGARSSHAIGITVAENTAPSAPTVAIEPDPAMTGSGLSATILKDSVDPDGDAVTYAYGWSVNGAAAGAGTSVDGVAVARGQTWVLSVVASDGTNEAAPASASTVIVNAPPVIDTIEVLPAAPTVADALNCVVTGARDPEADTVERTTFWTVDGVETGAITDVLPVGSVHGGQTVACGARLDDGRDVATFVSTAIAVVGTAPTIPTVSISPDPAMDTDDLVCIATGAVDPDGSAITYAYTWTVDGVAASIVEGTAPAAGTHRDEVWACTVTAIDEEGLDSTNTSAPITVGLAWQETISAADADVVIDGVTAGGAFAKTIALVGDINGDGLAELVVGASGEDASAGVVYLFDATALTGALTTADASARWTGSAAGVALGGYRALAAPGDLDADGRSELMFAAPDDDENGEGAGMAMLQYGGGTPVSGDAADAADWTVVGTLGDQMGARIATGDLDGDGLIDVVLAAPRSSDSFRNSGTVSIFAGTGARWSGRADIADADFQVYGDDESEELGWTTKFIGDVNGDGVDDLFTTAIYADTGGVDAGLAGIIAGGISLSGGDALSGAAVTLFSGDASDDRFGYDAAGGFDFDEDGVGDLMVGEYLDDSSGNNAGAVRIFLGRSGWASGYVPADADHTLYGTGADDHFGHVIQSPGDVDGDGSDDVLIGALFADPGGLAAQGAAWLILGPDWDAVGAAADIATVLTGEAANDWFGDALGVGEGDVNGDGRVDFAVGAQAYDASGSATGRAYVWFGR